MLKAVLFCFNEVHFFKVFIESVTILLMVYDSVFWLQGVWDFSAPPGKEPAPPASEGEVPITGPPGSPQNIFSQMISIKKEKVGDKLINQFIK